MSGGLEFVICTVCGILIILFFVVVIVAVDDGDEFF